jgi:probable addiction module antidote protein
MPKRTKDYHAWLLKRLVNPREAEKYLKAAMADSQEMFFKALRNVAEANKIAKVAEEAGVNRESLYKTLSEEGNPRYSTLDSVLSALGMHLDVKLKNVTSQQAEPSPINAETPAVVQLYVDESGILETGTWTVSGFTVHPVSSVVSIPSDHPVLVPLCLVAADRTSDTFTRIT